MTLSRTFQVGGLRCHTLEGGMQRLDGGAMFGVVPKVLWNREQPADEKNRIRLALRCLLLVGHGRTILVDGGIGDKHASAAAPPSKFGEIYAIEDAPSAAEALRLRAGLDPAAVTDVIATHLHFDHAGGLTRRAADGVDLSFPNANVFVQSAHMAWAQSPPPKERASFLPENVDPIAGSPRLRLLAGPETVAPGVTVAVKAGHTTGFQVIEVRGDGAEKLVFLSDLVPTASHLKLPYVMGYDNQPIVTQEEKRDLFARAARNGDTLFFEHDPSVIACRLSAEAGGERYAPIDVLREA